MGISVDHRPQFPSDFRLILASQSPRRHSLLRDVDIPFTVVTSEAKEILRGGSAVELAEGNALAKVNGACVPADLRPGDFVLATDTLVTIDDVVMGKPGSAAEVTAMLRALSGRTHQVISGVALVRARDAGCITGSEEVRVASAVTDVTFLPVDDRQIEAYVASGEWRGKAGGYAVQGLAGLFVTEVKGEYSNVVGLPLCLLYRLFNEFGFDLVQRKWL